MTACCMGLAKRMMSLMKPHGYFGKCVEASRITCMPMLLKTHRKAIVEGDAKGSCSRVAATGCWKRWKKQWISWWRPFKSNLRRCWCPACLLNTCLSWLVMPTTPFLNSTWPSGRIVADECIMPMQTWLPDKLWLGYHHATCPRNRFQILVWGSCHPILQNLRMTWQLSLTHWGIPQHHVCWWGPWWHPCWHPQWHPWPHFSSIPPLPGVLPTGGLGMGPVPVTTALVFGGAPLAPVPAGMVTSVSNLFQVSTALSPGFGLHCQQASVLHFYFLRSSRCFNTEGVWVCQLPCPFLFPYQGHPSGRPNFSDRSDPGRQLGGHGWWGWHPAWWRPKKNGQGCLPKAYLPGSKHAHDNKDVNEDEEEEGEDGNSSMFEDLDEVASTPIKRASKAKSPTKSGSQHVGHLQRWMACIKTDMPWISPEMKDYCQNYLTETHKKTFNLKNHSKYLDIILLKPSITQDVVFTKEAGYEYFKKCTKSRLILYDQGQLIPLPAVPGSKRFPDKKVLGILYHHGDSSPAPVV